MGHIGAKKRENGVSFFFAYNFAKALVFHLFRLYKPTAFCYNLYDITSKGASMHNRNAGMLDKNFEIPSSINKSGMTFYDAKDLSLHGIEYIDGKYRRMRAEDAELIGEKILMISSESAGGRVKFRTNSNRIAIYARYHSIAKVSNYSLSATMGFDIYTGQRFIGVFVPPFDTVDSYESLITLPYSDGSMQEYTINFPICSEVKQLLIGIDESSCITIGTGYKTQHPIVFYGSSTTQGACASRPGNAYPNMVSRGLDADFINLGFWGNAKGEELMANYIAGLKMSAFVYDYDYNAPSAEHLMATHEKMFSIIRKANPSLPIIILSAPKPYPNEDDIKRNEIIRKTYENAVNNGDNNVYLLFGNEILSSVRDAALADNIHPGDVGFAAIAEAVISVLGARLCL